MAVIDETTGCVLPEENFAGYKAGTEIHERIELRHENSRERNLSYLIARYCNAVKYILAHHPELQVSWPVISHGHDFVQLFATIEART